MRSLLPILVLLSLLFSACGNNADPGHYLLTNTNIIDIESGEISHGQSIFIKGDTIADIFEDGAKEPEVSAAISMDGKFVIPGLWDMHIHLRGGEELIASNKELLHMFVKKGVTTVRDAGGDLTSSIFEWRSQIASDSLTGPYIYTSGPKIDGPDPTWEGSLEVVSKSDITAALDSLEALGVDYVKIYESRLSGQAYLEIVRQAEERGLTVTGHMPMSIFMDDAIANGLDGIEHLYYVLKGTSDRELKITADVYNGRLGFWDTVAELKDSYNEDTARVFYEQLVENNIYVVPTLHILDVLSSLHEQDHSDDKYLKYIPKDIQETYQRRLQLAQRRGEAAIRFQEELNTLFRKITFDMQQAGVKLLAGSDAGAYNSFVYPGISLHRELEQFVESGLTPLQALQSSSLNGARFFGDYDTTGSIEIGKKADLLVLNSNPLEDIKNTQQIHAVVLGGKILKNLSFGD